jgi:type II secretory pathway component PulK
MNVRRSIRRQHPRSTRRGAVLVAAMVCVMILALMSAALLRTVSLAREQSRSEARRMQAECVADAAVERTVARLRADPKFEGEKWDITADELQATAPAAVAIHVESTDNVWKVRIQADFPSDATLRARALREWELPKAALEQNKGSSP